MASVQTELLFELHMDLDQEAAQRVGATSRGTRLIGYIKGGTFEGPKLKGEVLPGGDGWLNQIVAVGVGTRTPTGLKYTVYTIL